MRLSPAGPGHPEVRRFMSVKRKGRDAIALQGSWAVRAAIAAGATVDAVFVCPPLLKVPWDGGGYEVSERLLRRMVDRDGPDGLAGIAEWRSTPLEHVRDVRRLVIADGVDLPGNLGTIIRCADGVGAGAVIVTDGARPTHHSVFKASMGTVLSTPVVEADRTEARSWLRVNNVAVVVADPAATNNYKDVDYARPVAVVVGSERHGVSPFWRDAADRAVSIPMLGVADSLNVGHAAALLLYEALAAQE